MGSPSRSLLPALAALVGLLGGLPVQASVDEARSCPQLFGTSDRVVANAAMRAQQITRLERTHSGGEVLVHQVGRWREPKPTRLTDVAIERILTEERQRAAVVRLEGALAELCGEGPFLVRADDAIGARVRVLSVMPHGLLLEQDEKLRTLPTTGHKIGVELVYTSNFMLVPGDSSSPVSTTASRSRSRGSRNELGVAKTGSASGLKAVGATNKAASIARRQKANERRQARATARGKAKR